MHKQRKQTECLGFRQTKKQKNKETKQTKPKQTKTKKEVIIKGDFSSKLHI